MTVPPVGVATLGETAATVAVNVSGWPYATETADTVTVTVVAGLGDCERAGGEGDCIVAGGQAGGSNGVAARRGVAGGGLVGGKHRGATEGVQRVAVDESRTGNRKARIGGAVRLAGSVGGDRQRGFVDRQARRSRFPPGTLYSRRRSRAGRSNNSPRLDGQCSPKPMWPLRWRWSSRFLRTCRQR